MALTRRTPNFLLSLAGFCLLLLLPLVSSGAGERGDDALQLLMLTSQRNAETIAEAARQFNAQHAGYRIVARSDVQLWEMTPRQQQALIDASDLVLGAGLFGASVAELTPRFAASTTPRLIFNSDHRLIRLSQVTLAPVFDSDELLRELAGMAHSGDFNAKLVQLQQRYPAQAEWLGARRYWQAGGSANIASLFAWGFNFLGADIAAPPATPVPRLRWQYRDAFSTALPALVEDKPLLVVLDHAGGDRPADNALLRELCRQAEEAFQQQCLIGLAYWGEAGVAAVETLKPVARQLSAIVMLQDFVIGGGEGREQVADAFESLNVPVIKAIKLRDRTPLERQLSADGLAHDKVYYQVAMPELQGASQPLVIAAAGEVTDDPMTGIRIQPITGVAEGMTTLLSRVSRWQRLQAVANNDKRVAIVYYNHPPGRHNIGADNLDVPASLWQMLNRLKAEGYNTGELPPSQEALLDLMQERGVNLPNDPAALQRMSPLVTHMSADVYRQWFSGLPASIQREMVSGPFGLLHEQLRAAVAAGEPALAEEALHHTVEEMHHLLEGVEHPARDRALALLGQLEHCYDRTIEKRAEPCWDEALTLINALQQTGIEGLGGWGEAPGRVMTYEGELLLPGIRFGNIFIGPQPPRGWEINEELLHANLAFPPPHQYLAFYHYLRDVFRAGAFVHLGRHSTYEFLPRRSVGLAEDDYSRIIASDVPGIYPYIVDGVGEGIQAKRRGLAVMVDHLTPPLEHTPLYDDLLQLRQLIESFEASHGTDNVALEKRLVTQIRDKVDALELRDELAEAMSAELAVMGISFDEVDDDMLVHEVGHYLTDLQERFMPLGLHVLGRDWSGEAVNMMLDSMAPASDKERRAWQQLLLASPDAEMDALLRGLDGGFIAPGPGNDPIRSPDSLPTGRNFYALDNSLIPSPVAWELGREMAANARSSTAMNPGKREALVLWASDVVRDEGVMIAFGLDMLGLEPVWNSRGLVKGLKRRELAAGEVRRDMVFTTSGLFRDLYSLQMALLDEAVLMALDASADTIRKDYPALTLALAQALQPLQSEQGSGAAMGGSESLKQNQVAAHWVKQARALLAAGHSEAEAGALASLRVFGDAPGSYGAGVNRLVERSGAWQQRAQLAEVYLRRLGHSYGRGGEGSGAFGAPVADAFRSVLVDVENTWFGRSSNLYGLIDNNDAFDYLGGLSLAVETLSGTAPNNFVLNHANPERVYTEPLAVALRQELRGRFLNPEWLQGLMEHGYAGARTMGSEFLEYLWGWQVTNPTLVGDWAWQEVKDVYVDDRYDLQLDTFLEAGHNVHVKSNMLAIMLVAIHKDFWHADEATTEQLAAEFAKLVSANGLPGSGHTTPDHPMLPWLQQHLNTDDWQALEQVIERAKAEPEAAQEIHRLTEVELQEVEQPGEQAPAVATQSESAEAGETPPWRWLLLAALLLVIAAGFYRGLRHARPAPGHSQGGSA
ncbi:cobaltochelatase subunit CobN [Parahaliea aestuarii]|uniref:Cobaltochelatase subunit CobN n=1 Tax=Parahaliea aestuarii TaxID=1852021 RepID=A0A5C8ZVY7_9GAMM|nr:cobaltochelatase subunit CobN [Parahaliea aestuarii]TXS91627.1 cobaltochelatase subunit CobN [Parahaliea aestuarii]